MFFRSNQHALIIKTELDIDPGRCLAYTVDDWFDQTLLQYYLNKSLKLMRKKKVDYEFFFIINKIYEIRLEKNAGELTLLQKCVKTM